MNNGKHVVNHLFFRRKFDLVDDNELAVMLVTNVTNEFEAEAHQSILMGNDQTANFTTANSVYKSQKLRSLEIHATADFRNPLIDHRSTAHRPHLHGLKLAIQIRLLTLAADSAIDNRNPVLSFDAHHRTQV